MLLSQCVIVLLDQGANELEDNIACGLVFGDGGILQQFVTAIGYETGTCWQNKRKILTIHSKLVASVLCVVHINMRDTRS